MNKLTNTKAIVNKTKSPLFFLKNQRQNWQDCKKIKIKEWRQIILGRKWVAQEK